MNKSEILDTTPSPLFTGCWVEIRGASRDCEEGVLTKILDVNWTVPAEWAPAEGTEEDPDPRAKIYYFYLTKEGALILPSSNDEFYQLPQDEIQHGQGNWYSETAEAMPEGYQDDESKPHSVVVYIGGYQSLSQGAFPVFNSEVLASDEKVINDVTCGGAAGDPHVCTFFGEKYDM